MFSPHRSTRPTYFGESLSRLIFSMFSSVIILIGTFFFGFIVNGFVTFINMMILSIIALIVFLGFGFVVSGIAKNESAVPPIANLITLPQFLLAGTFFPISNFLTGCSLSAGYFRLHI
ncbi:MAG: ABC transporter permease [Ignavibacteria bacterium]